MIMRLLERRVLTIKLVMSLSVKKLDTFMIVMTHAGKLYWILQMVCWCALFQATVLIGCCCHQMKRSKMWTNKKLVRQDEAEPFMGLGRFARAYLLGYNCDDEKELEAA
ncbi:uncharacterized protein LOC132042543 isoform X4 [Lycium ferocissimum]|uniref:uncharacterized protein LOC132042543 isoform X4 n=1 Tax=Lycium ferocissimum TaxID=112874 RepID=UPI00281538A0|nr:uncharacterized protein LOC132042543 isoform X4 [Lycium ferocissimum]XP_059289053.1 uncharacterized protein LOC132042543 isoform X4 [Lycium ferocissimum]